MLNVQQKERDILSRNLELEEILLSHALVKDCLVTLRRNLLSNEILVAYVVTTQSMKEENLYSYIKAKEHDLLIPGAFVFINSMPLLENGEIDYDYLFSLPVIDHNRLKKVEESLDALGVFDKLHLSEEFISENEKVSSKLRTHQPPSAFFSEGRISENKSHTLSLVHGPSLQGHKIVNSLCDHLRIAANEKTKGIQFINEQGEESFYTYSSLMEDAKKVLNGLHSFGISEKDKVLLQIGDQQEMLLTFWACVLGGIIPLPISPLSNDDPKSSQAAKLLSAWEILEKPMIISDRKTIGILKNLLIEKAEGCLLLSENLKGFAPVKNLPKVNEDDIALLLLTSGSTGSPKIVTQTHKALTHRSYAAALMNQFTHQDIFLNWFPLDHVGGIVMFHIQAVAVVADQIQSTMGIILHNPLEWLNLIEKYKATVTWAPNFAYGLVNKALTQFPEQRWNLSTMRFILNGGEAISSEQALLFLKNLSPFDLSEDCMHPSWGMSETCSGVAFSDSFFKNANKSNETTQVGAPIAGVSFRIVDETETILTEGHIGALEIKGAPVTQGYYRNEVANKESFSTDGWFKTGDKALIENGKLTITGRDKDVIIINGLNHSCNEIETAIEDLDGIKPSFAAAIGVRYKNSTTDQLIVFFVPTAEDSNSILNSVGNIRGMITRRFNILPDFIIPLEPSDIPKTSIGKIRRSLLKERFHSGSYDRTLRLMDPSNLLMNASYSASWKKKALFHPLNSISKPEKYLVIAKTIEKSLELTKELEHKGHKVYVVEHSATFEKVTGCHTKINASNGEKEAEKIEEILDEHNITAIIDLHSIDDDIPSQKTAQEVLSLEKKTCLSIIDLLKSIKKGSAVRRIIYCTNYSQKVGENESIVPAKATALGILKAVSQERPQLFVKHLDILGTESSRSICRELEDFNKDIEVAYRGNERYVKGLYPVVPQLIKNPLAPAIKPKGFYVITGGLGGIGFELAKRLIQVYEVNLLLIGRMEMPDRHLWQQYLEDGLPEAEKIKALKQLQSMKNGKVLYASGDIADTKFIQSTLDQAKTFYNSSLNGIFHLAGVFEECDLNDCNEEHLDRVLEAKTLGAWNLYNYALRAATPITFVTFSSANGYFSGPNNGAYSAANVYLEALSKETSPHIHHYCFSWSMWEDTGMSKGYTAKELTKLRGYKLLKKDEALDAMFDGIAQTYSSLIIGIDGANLNMHAYLNTPVKSQKQIKVEYQLKDSSFPLEFPPVNLDRRDSFGNELNFDFQKMMIADKVESNSLAKNFTTSLTTIWETVLEIENINQNDNFFDLGGHSLLMIKVREKIKEELSMDVEMVDLFKFPTIKSLSKHLSDSDQPKINIDKVLKSIWSEILEFEEFSREDNFFDLGGHSLLMIKIKERINQDLNVAVEMIDLFKYPTLNGLAQFLKRQQEDTVSPATSPNTISVKKNQRRYRRQ